MQHEEKSFILLDGTSSSGKSTIAKMFGILDYFHIEGDTFIEGALNNVYSEIENEYVDLHEVKLREISRLMVLESNKHNKVMFDWVDQLVLKFINERKLFIVIVYSPLYDLIRNLKSRQTTSPRGIFVFEQYEKKYEQTIDISKSIDIINRKEFVDLLKTIKYEFKTETDLVDFANKIFKGMGIDNDNDHHIKLRDDIAYDYILNTKNKKKEELFIELEQQISL